MGPDCCSIQLTGSWLSVTYTRLHDLNGPHVTLLNILKQTLNLFMAVRDWNVRKLRTVYMFNVRELTNGLIDDSLLVVTSLGDTTLA